MAEAHGAGSGHATGGSTACQAALVVAGDGGTADGTADMRAAVDACALEPASLRRAFGAFATGVVIVTALDGSGRPAGMTVNSFTAVSLAPPLVLWCVQGDVPPGEAFVAAGHYAVHVLHAGQQALSDRFADPATLGRRFEGVTLEEGAAGLPLIVGCATRMACQVVQRHEAGDHLILVGRVLTIEHSPAAPLVFHAGRYATA
jgi:flavin reductase (DIM6/NTAB) family NADH-FMN oxidoreductase RutF